MKILGIETSCDETAISIIQGSGDTEILGSTCKVLANVTLSQAKLHNEYGGVFPSLARREHEKNLIPVFIQALKNANLYKTDHPSSHSENEIDTLENILVREKELLKQFKEVLSTTQKPEIDAIAVTYGPGLEPALWAGVNFAKALGAWWSLPIIPVNHMEGHIWSVFAQDSGCIVENVEFPMLSLLVSGGHTELVLIKDFGVYEIIGQTRDDAAGEAFDKTARLLGLPYPGGQEIAKLAEQARKVASSEVQGSSDLQLVSDLTRLVKLPRPMINTKDFDFSFSGLKTAVLYLLRDLKKEHSDILENVGIKSEIAKEIEDAIVEVLVKKTMSAIEHYHPHALIVAGGVSANNHLQKIFKETLEPYDIKLFFPAPELTGDNALMIALVGYLKYSHKNFIPIDIHSIRVLGNLSFL